MARQADMASIVAYGLASLPFLALPILFMAPLAYARFAPVLYNLNEAMKQIEEPSSPLNDALQMLGLGGSSSSSNSESAGSQSAASTTSSVFTKIATQKFAQALGLPLSDGIKQSAAAASALGEAIFSPGVFAPLGTGHKYNVKDPSIFQQISQYQQQSSKRPSNVIDTPEFNPDDNKISNVAKALVKTFSNGIRRYEMNNNDCRERLVCEMNQKLFGSSGAKSWLSAFMDVVEEDKNLQTKFFGLDKGAGNAIIKHLVKGTRTAFTNRDCAELYPDCSHRRKY